MKLIKINQLNKMNKIKTQYKNFYDIHYSVICVNRALYNLKRSLHTQNSTFKLCCLK